MMKNHPGNRLRFRTACFALCVTLICLLFTPVYASAFHDDYAAIDQAVDSMLMLYTYSDDSDTPIGQGSGFVAFSNELLITNYHVVEGGSSVLAMDDNDNIYELDQIIAASQEQDIAILQFSRPTDFTPLTLNTDQSYLRGQPVVAIGSPHGVKNTVSTGNISAIVKEYGTIEIQFTAPISPGSSGGALFNDEGEVIGITSSYYIDGQNMNYAIDIGYVTALYDSAQPAAAISLGSYPWQSGAADEDAGVTNSAAGTRVFDHAGLFSAEEMEALEEGIAGFQANTGYDFAVLVTDYDHGYDDYQELANDFAISKSLGLGLNYTLILCYLDIYNGSYYISVYGDLSDLMSDDNLQYLIEQGNEYFAKYQFFEAFMWTIGTLDEALTNIASMSPSVRVYDFAEFLTELESAKLEAAIAEFRALSGMDFLYLSTDNNTEGDENREYMLQFYDKRGFGEGEERSGVMMYLNLDTDTKEFDYYIRNFGDMDAYMSQEALDGMMRQVMPLMNQGKTLDAILTVIDTYSALFISE